MCVGVCLCVEGGFLMPRSGTASFLLLKCAQRTKRNTLVKTDATQGIAQWPISKSQLKALVGVKH